MRILALDYGEKRIGTALGENGIVQPGPILPMSGKDSSLTKLAELCYNEKVKLIVVGKAEGRVGERIKRFVSGLRKKTKLKVELVDETLTTHQAKAIGLRKQSGQFDSLAAAILLERYFEKAKNV